MSLSTQMARGTLALPLLAIYGLLALSSQHPAPAEPILLMSQFEPAAHPCANGAQRDPALLLAQTPVDLSPMTKRWRQGCRA